MHAVYNQTATSFFVDKLHSLRLADQFLHTVVHTVAPDAAPRGNSLIIDLQVVEADIDTTVGPVQSFEYQ